MLQKSKSILIGLIKYAFAFGLIFWLIQSGKINFNAIKVILAPQFLMTCFLLVFANLATASERWRFLLRSQGVNISPLKAFELTLIGIFFNFAMPGGVGGDVVKGVFITQQFPDKRGITAMSVLMDRVLGLYSMVFIAAVTMLFDYEHVSKMQVLRSLFFFLILFLILASIFFAVAFSKNEKITQLTRAFVQKIPLGNFIYKVYQHLHSYGQKKHTFWYTLIYSLIAQTFVVLLIATIGYAMGFSDLRLSTYFLVVPLGLIATALPISPAGVGVGQAAFYFLFNLYTGKITDLGSTSVTVWQIIMFSYGLLGAFFYLRRKAIKK